MEVKATATTNHSINKINNIMVFRIINKISTITITGIGSLIMDNKIIFRTSTDITVSIKISTINPTKKIIIIRTTISTAIAK